MFHGDWTELDYTTDGIRRAVSRKLRTTLAEAIRLCVMDGAWACWARLLKQHGVSKGGVRAYCAAYQDLLCRWVLPKIETEMGVGRGKIPRWFVRAAVCKSM